MKLDSFPLRFSYYYFDSAQDFILFLCLEIDGTKVMQRTGGILFFFIQLLRCYHSLITSKAHPGSCVEIKPEQSSAIDPGLNLM
jgi:hypothetical protein